VYTEEDCRECKRVRNGVLRTKNFTYKFTLSEESNLEKPQRKNTYFDSTFNDHILVDISIAKS
jgi:hypothetical protein